MVVDLAAYFDKMSEADRILWNADARMLLNNTNVSFVYTDESTGKEETVDVVSGLIAGFTKLKRILSICTTRDSQTISFNTILQQLRLKIRSW